MKKKELIKSFEKNGYIDKYPIVVNKDLLFIDGAHRLALALYFGIDRIPITIDKNYYNFESKDYSFDWFEKKNMGYIKEEAMKKYEQICRKYGG